MLQAPDLVALQQISATYLPGTTVDKIAGSDDDRALYLTLTKEAAKALDEALLGAARV